MFHPQPTPFAATCFNSFGAPPDFTFAPAPLTLQNPSNHNLISGPATANASSHRSGLASANSNAGGSNSGRRRDGSGAHVAQHLVHRHRPHARSSPAQQQRQHRQAQSLLYHRQPPRAPSSASSSSSTSSQGRFHGLSAYDPSAMEQGDGTGQAAQSQALQDELAAQEAAAREYQPQLEGPLVGDKTPSTAITNEYAKADAVYVEKTLALPNTYSHYRPIQGDGNCGWRAIGFSYFEALIEGGNKLQVEAEVDRITGLNQVLISVGYQQFLFEDMVEETIGLLKEIGDHMPNRDAAMDVLTKRFNDAESSNAIIYHLRLLAGSWLKGDPALYEPFVQDLGVAGYCSDVIEKVDREIEHVGIMLLYNVLLKPVDIVLEIAYLDRSPGDHVNVYRFPDGSAGPPPSPMAPVIYLLYRPDHYDILYKGVNIQVNRVAVYNHHADISPQQPLDAFSSVDYASLSMVPGLLTPTAVGLSSLGSPADQGPPPQPPPAQPVMSEPFAPAPNPPWIQTQFDHAMTPQPSLHTPTPTSLGPPPPRPPPPSSAAEASTAASPATTYTLRFSEQYYQLDNAAFPEPNFTTSMFKNSHFNKAHYNNPDFHPEEWTPDDEAPEKGTAGKKKFRAGKHE